MTRGIEMMLLVKTEGRWQILSQAWGTEGVSNRGREPSRRPLNRPVTGRNDDSGPSNGPLKPPFHVA